MKLRSAPFAMAAVLASCGGGNAAQRPDCPAGQTSLDGTCVSQQVADYVACIRAMGATVAADSAKSLSAAAGVAGVTGSTQAEVKDKLEKSYATVSDANALEIIRNCYSKTTLGNGATQPSASSSTAASVGALKGVAMRSATQLDIPGNLDFASGRPDLVMSDATTRILSQLGQALRDNPSITLLAIEGNTDNDGSDSENRDLSQGRAQAIVDRLVRQGVDAGRLQAIGRGASNPLVPNDSPAHKAMNRRMEFFVRALNGQHVSTG